MTNILPPGGPTPVRQRDPLHLLIAAGVIAVVLVGLILAGVALLRSTADASSVRTDTGSTLPSCSELQDQASELVAKINSSREGTQDYQTAIDDMVSVAGKLIAQNCPPAN